MRAIAAAFGEFRRNALRSLIKVSFLVVALGFQLSTAVESSLATVSIDHYSESQFGRAVTMKSSSVAAIDIADAIRFTELLPRVSSGISERPLRVTFSFSLTASELSGGQGAHQVSAIAVPGTMEPVAPVAAPDNRMSGESRIRLASSAFASGTMMRLSDDSGQSGGTAQHGTGFVLRPKLTRDAIAIAAPGIQTKEFTADVILDYDAAVRLQPASVVVSAYWRLDQPKSGPEYDLLQATAKATGLSSFDRPLRVDEHASIAPILTQRLGEQRKFATVLLFVCIAALAAVEWTAAEIKIKRYTLFRCLGAPRLVVGALTMVENLVAASISGAIVLVGGSLLLAAWPHALNPVSDIPIVVDGRIPIGAVALISVTTLLCGLLVGVPAALRSSAARLAFD